jgi:hypothetical protein
LTVARPVSPSGWFDETNWEQLLPGKKVFGLELFRVTVKPDGNPQDCTIEVTAGTPELDKLVCEQVMSRAQFKPARWADGTRAYAIYRNNILWANADSFDYERPIDVKIEVNHLPRGTHSPVSFAVVFAVGPDGKISLCQTVDRTIDPGLASIACGEVTQSYPAIPAHDETGKAVASIQNLTVGFVVK